MALCRLIIMLSQLITGDKEFSKPAENQAENQAPKAWMFSKTQFACLCIYSLNIKDYYHVYLYCY